MQDFQTLSHSAEWNHSTAVLAYVQFGRNEDKAPQVFTFSDAADAVEFCRKEAERGASCGVALGRLSNSLVERTQGIAEAAASGQVLMTLAVQDLVRDQVDGVTFIEVGNFDIQGRLERLFSVSSPAPRPDVPVIAYPRAGSFIGRAAELEGLRRAIDATRLVTLHGQPGVGKSALLNRFVAEYADPISDSVVILDLGNCREQQLALPALMRLLEVVRLPGEDSSDALISHLRRKDCLLVLDNCQHVMLPIKKLVHRILAECPQVGVVVGSQRATRLAGEVRVHLKGLECPSPAEPWQVIREYEAPAVYEEYARRCDPTFAINEMNAADVAVLCRRLDGVPLAIELSAAKAHILSPKQLVRRLEDRFLLLQAPSSPVSLKQAIGLAYDLLSPSAQALLRRLSLFCGSFSIEWAGEICEGAARYAHFDLFSAFEELVDCSLLSPSGIASTEKLFQLPESIRAFARELLKEANDQRQAESNHAAWCARLSAEASAGLNGGDQVTWLSIMDATFPDMRQVIAREVLPRGNADLAIQTLISCYPYLWERNYFADGLYLAEKVSQSRAAAQQADYPRVLNLAGVFASSLGRHEDARRYSLLCLRLARASGNLRQQASGWTGVAMAHHYSLKPRRALRCFLRSAELLRRIEDRQSLYRTLLNIVVAESELAMYDEAQLHLDQALAMGEGVPLADQAATLLNGAHLSLAQHDFERALEYSSKALQMCLDLSGRDVLARALRNCAYAFSGLGRHTDAAIYVGLAKAAQREADTDLPLIDSSRFEALEHDLIDRLGYDSFQDAQRDGMMMDLEDLRQAEPLRLSHP